MKFRVLLLSLLLFTLSYAQPIAGEAQKLEFQKDKIIYTGNVKLVRGESVLKADKVIVFLNEKGKPTKIVAVGQVRFSEPKRKARADYAEYDLSKEVIILRGSARVEEEKNILEAEEIVYDRKNQTLEAKGGSKRVRTIYIEEEKNEKIGSDKGDSP